MTLRRELWVLGVALPALALCIVMVLVDRAFARALAEDLDRRLLAQAAVESVSLFDGPDGRPHLHAPTSPLAHEVQRLGVVSALYDPRGVLLVATATPAPARPADVPCDEGRVHFSTSADESLRELVVCVDRPDHGRHLLQLVTTRRMAMDELAALRRIWASATAAVLVVLVPLLAWRARRLVHRLAHTTGRAARLGTAGIEDGPRAPLPPSPADELGALDRALDEASTRIERAQQAERRFLANAAHQLQTPLAVLRTELDLALRKPRSAEALREALAESRAHVDRMTALARALLHFEALRVQDDRTRVALASVVEAASAQLATLARARDVTVTLALEPLEVRGSALLLGEAYANVLDNARRFAPAGSSVEVTLTRAGDQARLAVADRGPGVASALRPRLFEPFARGDTPEFEEGTGLGLAFTHSVVEQHGGRLRVEDRPGGGTVVVVELPLEPSLVSP